MFSTLLYVKMHIIQKERDLYISVLQRNQQGRMVYESYFSSWLLLLWRVVNSTAYKLETKNVKAIRQPNKRGNHGHSEHYWCIFCVFQAWLVGSGAFLSRLTLWINGSDITHFMLLGSLWLFKVQWLVKNYLPRNVVSLDDGMTLLQNPKIYYLGISQRLQKEWQHWLFKHHYIHCIWHKW